MLLLFERALCTLCTLGHEPSPWPTVLFVAGQKNSQLSGSCSESESGASNRKGRSTAAAASAIVVTVVTNDRQPGRGQSKSDHGNGLAAKEETRWAQPGWD